jgi:hypothetical protein
VESSRKRLALFLFLLAGIVLAHQYYTYGVLFEVKDIHHESFVIALVFAGLVLWFYTYSLRFANALRLGGGG